MDENEVPRYLSHQPIVSVDYSMLDADAGDAKFLSLGKSTWNKDEISAKIFRRSNDDLRWSRQSEEIPLWRVLDLAKLLTAVITGQESSMREKIVAPNDIEKLHEFIQENMELYLPRLQELKKLLNMDSRSTEEQGCPNLFSFATSELSQDALIAWLLNWADDSYKSVDADLCILGKALVSLCTGLQINQVHNVRAGRQLANIDIYAEINDDAFLVIEDKTGTSTHDNQLERYKNFVQKKFSQVRNTYYFAYIKTENEPHSVLKQIQNQGYKTIDRKDLLDILSNYQGNNSMIKDYRSYLENIENATQRFMTLEVDRWEKFEWQGFYKELEKYIDVASWSYVANPSGGFWGLWWNFVSSENNNVEMYLQFEQNKLCVKIHCKNKDDRARLRNEYHNLLIHKAKEIGLNVCKPTHFGTGTYMTIGIVPDIFNSDRLDTIELVRKLKNVEDLVHICMEDVVQNIV